MEKPNFASIIIGLDNYPYIPNFDFCPHPETLPNHGNEHTTRQCWISIVHIIRPFKSSSVVYSCTSISTRFIHFNFLHTSFLPEISRDGYPSLPETFSLLTIDSCNFLTVLIFRTVHKRYVFSINLNLEGKLD